MQHTITFRAERGLVVGEVRSNPSPEEIVARWESDPASRTVDPAPVIARFEWLPHYAREKVLEALTVVIKRAESEGLS